MLNLKTIKSSDIKIKPRAKDSSKADYGRARIMGGSARMPGAPVMSAAAALRAGAGLVTLGVPQSMAAAYQARALETMLYFFRDEGGFVLFDEAQAAEFCEKADVLALGMGMGQNFAEIRKFISYYLSREITLIIDADGINALQGYADLLLNKNRKATVILTPHIVEFSRLIDTGGRGSCNNSPDLQYIKDNKLELATAFAARHNAVLLLKGAETLITDGKAAFLNTVGTPALAKGGSGDVLTGIIAGLAATYPPLTAATYGAYFLGKAALAAEKVYGENSVLASDVISNIKIIGG